MGYKLVPLQGLYLDDIPNIVRPFVAKRVLQDAFTFSATSILGLRNHVSPLGNKDLQQQKLIRDIENGRIVLLATPSDYGTIGENYTGHGQSGFDLAIQQIKRSAKQRPLWGYTRDDDSFLDYAKGVYKGAESYVEELIESKLEFISDLAGSAVYDHTGYEGAKEAHNRTLKRADALVQELKQIDKLVDGLTHIIQHPSDTANALLDIAKEKYDKHQELLEQGKRSEAGAMVGIAATELFDVITDSPVKKAKKAAKLGKLVKNLPHNKCVYNPHRWRKVLEDRYPKKVTSTTVPPINKTNVKLAGQRHPDSGVVFDNRGFPDFSSHIKCEIYVDFKKLGIKNNSPSELRATTRQLRKEIKQGKVPKEIFNEAQLKNIKSGRYKIQEYTWHHNERYGRMQLVLEQQHAETKHIGGRAMRDGR